MALTLTDSGDWVYTPTIQSKRPVRQNVRSNGRNEMITECAVCGVITYLHWQLDMTVGYTVKESTKAGWTDKHEWFEQTIQRKAPVSKRFYVCESHYRPEHGKIVNPPKREPERINLRVENQGERLTRQAEYLSTDFHPTLTRILLS